MQEKERKFPLSPLEIIFLAIVAIAVYVGAILLLGKPINHHMPNWFFGPIGFFMIFGFDIIWIIGMKLWKFKSVRIKIIKKILSVLVLALSASILTCWLILNLLSNIW